MTRPIVLSCFIVAMTLLGIIWFAIYQGFQNGLALKAQCTDAGGVITYQGNCVWSRVGAADGVHP